MTEIKRTLQMQDELVHALLDPACYAHPAQSARIVETHISFVILTGTYAYKIKKAVDLGFLDFTTLEKRRFFCEEELRLNARLAPQIYLDVVPICGTPAAPRVGGGAAVIEYAVRMREFPQEALADRVLARGELTPRHVDALAALVADLHSHAASSRGLDGYGAAEAVSASAAQNFTQVRPLLESPEDRRVLDDVEAWMRHEHVDLENIFARRKAEGMVRECHGDLHLGNIVFLDGEPRVFDCIEFNPEWRWIDVMNEVAFLVMDLRAANRADLARRFLNAYLEFTGDYAGLQVLRYYVAYRAMVRAKIGLMRASQLLSGNEHQAELEKPGRRYLALARDSTPPDSPFILVTRGFSGSGKTTLSQSLLELVGAIRIRSDVERKRIHGLASKDRPRPGIAGGIYAAGATESTYARLLDLAQVIVAARFGVIVDATFLGRGQRDMFRALAARAGVPFLIVHFTAGEAELRSRILARLEQGGDSSDADLAVLEHQLATYEALQSDELEFVFGYDASAPVDQARHPKTWTPVLQRLGLGLPA